MQRGKICIPSTQIPVGFAPRRGLQRGALSFLPFSLSRNKEKGRHLHSKKLDNSFPRKKTPQCAYHKKKPKRHSLLYFFRTTQKQNGRNNSSKNVGNPQCNDKLRHTP